MAHWIKIQLPKDGNRTFYDEIDLDHVQRIRVQYVDNVIEGVTIWYYNTLNVTGNFDLDKLQHLMYSGTAAVGFIHAWIIYRGEMKWDLMEPAKPSNIITATGSGLNPSKDSWRKDATLRS